MWGGGNTVLGVAMRSSDVVRPSEFSENLETQELGIMKIHALRITVNNVAQPQPGSAMMS